jgi:hypothetical protein
MSQLMIMCFAGICRDMYTQDIICLLSRLYMTVLVLTAIHNKCKIFSMCKGGV